MAKRTKDRAPTVKTTVSLPVHLFEAVKRYAELETKAYRLMHGTTEHSVSDQVSAGLEHWIRTRLEDEGPVPAKDSRDEAEFVKRLAAENMRRLREDLQSPSKH